MTNQERTQTPAECQREKITLSELRLASSVYQSSSEAMIVTDERNLIVSVNPAFTKITGYAPDEVIGKNPGLLHSGRQEPEFYRAMWDALDRGGHWAGEIWNRKKNGELYVEWLNINVIENRGQAAQRYVGLFSDITERKKIEKLVWTQANFDPLTDLPNRRLFADRLDQGIKRSIRSGTSMALLLLDLDRFKEVNDSHGHLIGDQLLLEAAARIASCVRDSDTVARLGGDEFAVILTDIGDPGHIDRVAEALLSAIARPYPLGDITAHVTASIGIALYPADAPDPIALLKHADQAMYQSKGDGRDRYCYFSSALDEHTARRARLIGDLRAALPGGQFELYFQPVLDLRSGRLLKAEALLRWHHPLRGLVEPWEVIPALEETGLIIETGDWVWREALRHGRRWSNLLGRPLRIAVNVSPVQLQAGAGAGAARWCEHMRAAGVAGAAMIIEITEGALLMGKPDVALALRALRAAGVELALDDFGTGYSALSCLTQFELAYLKIDRSLTRQLAPGSRELALSKAIIVMAHELGLRVIAEGVETAAQRDLLAVAGCDEGQGYWFSAPLPARQFERFLMDRAQGTIAPR